MQVLSDSQTGSDRAEAGQWNQCLSPAANIYFCSNPPQPPIRLPWHLFSIHSVCSLVCQRIYSLWEEGTLSPSCMFTCMWGVETLMSLCVTSSAGLSLGSVECSVTCNQVWSRCKNVVSLKTLALSLPFLPPPSFLCISLFSLALIAFGCKMILEKMLYRIYIYLYIYIYISMVSS